MIAARIFFFFFFLLCIQCCLDTSSQLLLGTVTAGSTCCRSRPEILWSGGIPGTAVPWDTGKPLMLTAMSHPCPLCFWVLCVFGIQCHLSLQVHCNPATLHCLIKKPLGSQERSCQGPIIVFLGHLETWKERKGHGKTLLRQDW